MGQSTIGISNKDLKDLADLAIRQGWEVRQRGSGHIEWQPPGDAEFYISSSSPSSQRTIVNIRTALRARGLILNKDEVKRIERKERQRRAHLTQRIEVPPLDLPDKPTKTDPTDQPKEQAMPTPSSPKAQEAVRKGSNNPVALAVVKWLEMNPDRAEHFSIVARECGLPDDDKRVGQTLASLSNKMPGQRAWAIYQRFLGKVHRVGVGTYMYSEKFIPIPHDEPKRPAAPKSTPSSNGTSTGAIAGGTLMEVVRTWDTGRILLADPDGVLYTGTLQRID